MLTFKNFNIADWFSFYRILAAPFLLVLIWYDQRLIFTWLLLISYLTDGIDGILARKLKITSARGSQLDSFGDQITLIVGLIGLYYFETDFITTNLVLIALVFVPYSIQMIIAYSKYGKATAFHTYLAKLSAVVQSIFILWSLFFSPNYVLFYIMIGVGLFETFEEITLIFMYDQWASDVKGVYWAYKDKKTAKKEPMKSFSLFTIIVLCLAILLIDFFAFYWLQSITQYIPSSLLKISIHVLFWIFTLGLIVSIIVLKVTLDAINPRRKQLLISRFYGLAISSFVPKFIFVLVISSLYFTNYLFSESQSFFIVPIVGLLSGFLPFFIIVYGIFKSVYRFKVHYHCITSKLLPKAFSGLKIVQISDLHLGSFNYGYNKLESAIDKINHLQPDYIVITGDLVNNYAWELRGWKPVFDKLKANKEKFAILGNHDYGDYSQWDSPKAKQKNSDSIKQFYRDINFKLLLNESIIISEDNEHIAFIGVENWGKAPFRQYGDLQKAITIVREIPFKILLSHDPSHWSEKVIDKTDIILTLAGHTHGMQAAFQYKNLQWSPIKYKFKHWAGLYKHNQQYLYVNRGLGWLGFPGRLGMRPEITLIELRTLYN